MIRKIIEAMTVVFCVFGINFILLLLSFVDLPYTSWESFYRSFISYIIVLWGIRKLHDKT